MKMKIKIICIDLSRVFDFRMCFGKTLVAFNFDENLTQSVPQITIAQKTIIIVENTFFACTLWLINFKTWFGKRKNAV